MVGLTEKLGIDERREKERELLIDISGDIARYFYGRLVVVEEQQPHSYIMTIAEEVDADKTLGKTLGVPKKRRIRIFGVDTTTYDHLTVYFSDSLPKKYKEDIENVINRHLRQYSSDYDLDVKPTGVDFEIMLK